MTDALLIVLLGVLGYIALDAQAASSITGAVSQAGTDLLNFTFPVEPLPSAPAQTGGNIVTNSTNLGPVELGSLALAAGFTGNDAVTAVAIALAESDGNPNAYNPETAAETPADEGSYGLWQIYLKEHPEFAGWNLYDPATNARAAFSVWKQAGGSFHPWSTYKSGAYQARLTEAQAGVNA